MWHARTHAHAHQRDVRTHTRLFQLSSGAAGGPLRIVNTWHFRYKVYTDREKLEANNQSERAAALNIQMSSANTRLSKQKVRASLENLEPPML